MNARLAPALAALVAVGACGAPEAVDRPSGTAPPPPREASGERPVVVFLGTSLTAGLGLDPAQAYPSLIERRIGEAGLPYEVVNAGVSGETSAAARRRVSWLLDQRVDVLVVETGANDALRGQDPEATRANLQAIIDEVRARPDPPALVLVGMQAPPNHGAEYARRFREVYEEVARANRVPLVPFLLEGVAGLRDLNQGDGVHPTAEGQQRMAGTVWRVLEPVLRAEAATPRQTSP